MPTDVPNIDDIWLAGWLTKQGMKRSARTCLRWRRQGVLLPPDHHDKNGQPIYSQAALDRAITYSRLVESKGYDMAVTYLWGDGADLPKKAVVGALQKWEEGRQQIDSAVSDRTIKDLRRKLPVGADMLTEHAKLRQKSETEDDLVFNKDTSPDYNEKAKTHRPSLTSVRQDLIAEAHDAAVMGGETALEAIEDYAAELGSPPHLVDAVGLIANGGGVVSSDARLALLEKCFADEETFAALVEKRDLVRSNFATQTKDILTLAPTFALLFAAFSDPAYFPEVVVRVALDSTAHDEAAANTTHETSPKKSAAQ